VFALDLLSAYEGEHTIFGLLGQAREFFESSEEVMTFSEKISSGLLRLRSQ
jgi:hypothetical protein